ncbi:MAG: hypothetical protein PUC17_02705, partial [Anaerostipes sp.]|nr:hypothetical protein [Anaerostipes sp.]
MKWKKDSLITKKKAAVSRLLQTVDKVGAGDNLQHHFSLKNDFSFNNRQILWMVEILSSLLASILA